MPEPTPVASSERLSATGGSAAPTGAPGAGTDLDNWLVDCLIPGATDPVVMTVKSCRESHGEQVGKPTPPGSGGT